MNNWKVARRQLLAQMKNNGKVNYEKGNRNKNEASTDIFLKKISNIYCRKFMKYTNL